MIVLYLVKTRRCVADRTACSTGLAVHAAGHLPRRRHAAADQTMQQSGAASYQQRRVGVR